MSDQVYYTPHEVNRAIEKLRRSRGIGREIVLGFEEGENERVYEAELKVEMLEGELGDLHDENDSLLRKIEQMEIGWEEKVEIIKKGT